MLISFIRIEEDDEGYKTSDWELKNGGRMKKKKVYK